MGVPEIYRKTGEVLANYDYLDIVNGLGYVTFQGFCVVDSTGNTYYLGASSPTIYSGEIEHTIGSGTSITFNSTGFNTSRTLSSAGKIYLNFSMQTDQDNSTFTCTLLRVRGAATTTIGSVVTAIDNGRKNLNRYICLQITTTSDIDFKEGDILRLTTQQTGSGANVILGMDPANRAGTTLATPATYPTRLNILLPFKIDA